jgi:outer membrane biosynthesis protein TonB
LNDTEDGRHNKCASGSVAVQILIDERGCIQTARALSGHPLLQAASVQASRQACFYLTLLSGQTVKVKGVITYNFIRDNGSAQ